MSATTMQFGPEWMRTKHQPLSRQPPPPSPPPSVGANASGVSTYSALVSPVPATQSDRLDEAYPFRYSKEDMLRIYREGGGRGGLGIEVERWDGVVREVGSEPVGLRELTEIEKKLFAGPLNSDLRRRQSTDYLSPISTNSLGSDRPRLVHNATSSTNSPLRERFGALKRRDSSDSSSVVIPRKQSLSNIQAPLISPRDMGLPSPRTRVGHSPGFDGILNSGESWVSRRRTSEASLKANLTSVRDAGGAEHPDEKPLGIQEEKEEEAEGVRNSLGTLTTSDSSSHSIPSPVLDHPQSDTRHELEYVGKNAQNIESSIGRLSISNNSVVHPDSHSGSLLGVGPPPGLVDLASVEWSYKDPSGQIQGPFRADLMQKWYDEGYFSPDLPMKRTHLDTHWILVEELARRAGNDKIFLAPTVQMLPPGLSRKNGSPVQNFGVEEDMGNNPYQPAPIRNLRSATLDSYINSASNASDSPSSSFSGGRFGDSSPDPTLFGGGSYLSGSGGISANGGGPGINGTQDISSPFAARLAPFHDPTLDPLLRARSSYGNLAPGRGTSVDGFNFDGRYSPTRTVWNLQTNNMAPGFDSLPINRELQANASPYNSNFVSGSEIPSYIHRNGQEAISHESIQAANLFPRLDQGNQQQSFGLNDHPMPGFSHYNSFGALVQPNDQQYSHSPVQEYAPSQQFPHLAGSLDNSFIQQTNIPKSSSYSTHISGIHPTNPSHTTNQPQDTWNSTTDPSLPRRPGPFDIPQPTTANVIVHSQPTPVPTSPWGRNSQPTRTNSHSNKEQISWAVASQGVVEEVWQKEPDVVQVAATVVNQVNEPKTVAPTSVKIDAPLVNVPLDQKSETKKPEAVVPPSEGPITTPTVHQKSRNKPSNQVPATRSPSPNILPQAEPALPAPATPKAPWAKEEEVKKPKNPVSVSLREIQEAEEKKLEARKAAERDREKATRATMASSEFKEDAQPFTASWGLPTSQAGVRGAVPAKETSSPSTPVATSQPVWTTAVKAPAAKKSMKEIQEEEERRKKLASKETVAAATRRAYAETTIKTPPTLQGGAWTTVGPNGKTAAAIAATKPSVIPAVQNSTPVSRSNGLAAPRTSASLPISRPSLVSKVDDNSSSPSHDFLKWLNDSLRGLNNSVNVEEIMSMLLSFPLDPDPSTVEIISDLIYANSTTLDGRRFSAEFVSKRKADAASRSKNQSTAGKTSTKPVSIADVVKAAPKVPQTEWGFKVVNKKKKGGRA